MKKVTLLAAVLLGLYGLSGCGGAPTAPKADNNESTATAEPTMGYYEIQNRQGEVLFRGIYDGGMTMLDENNLSHSSVGVDTRSEIDTDTGKESDCVFSFGLLPIDSSSDGAIYEFPMDCNYSTSNYVNVEGQNMRLLFDPHSRHTALKMKADNLSDKNLADPRDGNNTFVSTDSKFTLVTYLYTMSNDPVRCEMTGNLPNAQSNFASVEAPYTCADDQNGTAYVGFVSPDEGYATLLISVGADTADMQTHILAFE